MIVCIPTIPEILVSLEPLNHALPTITVVSQYLVWTCGIVFLEIYKYFSVKLKSKLFKFVGVKPQF